jgi:NAD(P)-dependent dehydrogenase (short-subunit alcohol dehydrogenase family)
MFELKNKKIVFFGAVGYLATPIIWKMAESGADLMLADFNIDRAVKIAEEMSNKYPGQKFASAYIDCSDYASIAACFEKIKATFGKLDVMVSGISAANNLTVEEFTPELMNKTFATHLTGSFLLARNSAELMPDGGSIVIFSSMYGQVAPDPSVYHAPMKANPIDYGIAKAGLNQMIRYLAVHWGTKNIRVNGVSPGPFPNPANYPGNMDFIERLDKKVPMGRVGKQDEMAGAVIYLASDESSFTNGHIINVDGGWTAW